MLTKYGSLIKIYPHRKILSASGWINQAHILRDKATFIVANAPNPDALPRLPDIEKS
jgi:hypothetical protein